MIRTSILLIITAAYMVYKSSLCTQANLALNASPTSNLLCGFEQIASPL